MQVGRRCECRRWQSDRRENVVSIDGRWKIRWRPQQPRPDFDGGRTAQTKTSKITPRNHTFTCPLFESPR
ncbi:hypothetical protein RSSM_00176 [Rhodopirellula sallentina SM41]|uniref:Uncharacterized protein n=1 Tax=Rhodopirellula sallentina SM41 TaxID=1263870 RepID=M5UAC0_9BACT|nr:hypothetical protein RSSM_00176 [Rhodopirellula sallentina SM41]